MEEAMRRSLVLVVAAVALTVGACGGSDGGVAISGAWARTSPAMASAGAVYMTLSSADGDALLGAAVNTSVAATTEVHETVMAESGDGAMKMQPVERIDLPAGREVALEPGGYHIMLLDLAAPLELGQKFDVTLDFENAGEKTVTVEVRDSAP
jgi:copper(I)-binding protein